MNELSSTSSDSVTLFTIDTDTVGQWLGKLGICYCRIFVRPPWTEAEHAGDRFLERLRAKSRTNGFRLVLALDETRQVVGFAYGATSFDGGEPEPWYGVVTDALNPGVVDAALVGTFELVEFGVIPEYRRQGVGSSLHDALLAEVTERRAWLMTRADALAARAFYHRHGWLELGKVRRASDSELTVLMTRRLPD